MSEKDKVVGKAVYLELRNGSQTYQVILTPDGVSSSGRAVPSTVYRRQISASKPRKAWKTYGLNTLPVNAFGTYDAATDKDANLATSISRLANVGPTFNQLKGYGYQLFKAPILVEVSQEDIEQIRLSKTPYKILGRVTRIRRTLGFGEALFAE